MSGEVPFPGFMMHMPTQRESEHVWPMPEAQIDTLRSLIAHTGEDLVPVESFSRGDLVEYFGPSGPVRSEVRKKAKFMFFRWLSADSVEDERRIAMADSVELSLLPTIDCLIVCFDGTDIRFHLASSLLLKAAS